MIFRPLFPNGPQVSSLSLGCWQTIGGSVGYEESKKIIWKALDEEINFFDTADVYSDGNSEKVLARSLRNINRDRYILATKCYFKLHNNNAKRLGKKNIENCVDSSLKNLGVDSIDLMQCHRFDEKTPLIETLEAMERMIKIGKVKSWGVSRWTSKELLNALELSDKYKITKPSTTQHFYNIFNREIEKDLSKFCKNYKIGLITYSPLAQGILSGKYQSLVPQSGTRSGNIDSIRMMWDFQPDRIEQVKLLKQFADELGISLSTLSLAWCLKNRSISSVIFGASKPSQVSDNVASLKFTLADDLYVVINNIIGKF